MIWFPIWIISGRPIWNPSWFWAEVASRGGAGRFGSQGYMEGGTLDTLGVFHSMSWDRRKECFTVVHPSPRFVLKMETQVGSICSYLKAGGRIIWKLYKLYIWMGVSNGVWRCWELSFCGQTAVSTIQGLNGIHGDLGANSESCWFTELVRKRLSNAVMWVDVRKRCKLM